MQLHYFMLLSIGSFRLSEAVRIVLKEGRSRNLQCNNNNAVLKILFAKYEGRPFYCGSNVVTKIVKTKCEGRAKCTVYATDGNFKDSCTGANEYLTIRYICAEQIVTETTSYIPTYKVSMTTDYSSDNTYNVSMTTDNTSSNYSFVNQTDKPLEPRASPLTSTETNETLTIATLVIGCIIGLILVGVITIVIFRRQNKLYEHDNVQVLTLTSTTDLEGGSQRPHNINSHEQNSTDQDFNTNGHSSLRGYRNNLYSLEAVYSHVTPENNRTISQETTECKKPNSHEYSVVQKKCASGDLQPPTYDVATSASMGGKFVTENSLDRYNHAHYTGEEYDQTTKHTACTNLSDGYSASATFLLESMECADVGSSSEHVYENQNEQDKKDTNFSRKSSESSEPSGKKKKAHRIATARKENKYDNVDFKQSVQNKVTYQNVDKGEGNNNHNGYMPMTFGQKQASIDENEYVPIMSPTATSMTSDMFDDTYQF